VPAPHPPEFRRRAVEFARQKIANIYDYTYALDAVKIGKPVKMIVERNGERVAINVTPEARK